MANVTGEITTICQYWAYLFHVNSFDTASQLILTLAANYELFSSISGITFFFYLRTVLAVENCRCMRVPVSVRACGNQDIVCAATRHPFNLGSPNLDQLGKRPWLRSLSFLGWLTLTSKVKFNFKIKIYPIWSLSAPLDQFWPSSIVVARVCACVLSCIR